MHSRQDRINQESDEAIIEMNLESRTNGKNKEQKAEKIFVSYAWDSEEFNKKVYSFVNMLRKNGFNAVCDKMDMQNETAPRFPRIMDMGLQADKVIVVLSSAYKQKANMEGTGVNAEYEIISSEIRNEECAKKYIFVSFEEITMEVLENIVPVMYKGVYIVDLTRDQNNDFQELFSKLLDKQQYDFEEVTNVKPEIHIEKLPDFNVQKDKLRINLILNSDMNTVTFDNMTKNNLRQWIVDKKQEIEIDIKDEYVESLLQWQSKQDEKGKIGEEFTEEEESNYTFISKAIQSYSQRQRLEKLAMRILLDKQNLETYVSRANVNQYLTIMQNIILFSRNMKERDRNKYCMVEGWLPYGTYNFFFKAYIRRDSISESARDYITFRDGGIFDFDSEDIVNEILPSFCLSLTYNWDKITELIKEDEGVLDLTKYKFGWA